MNEENFDRIFSEKIRYGKNIPFAEENWNKMEHRFDVFTSERRRQRRGALLTLLLLGSYGLLSWVSWSLHETRNDFNRLTREIQTLRQLKQTPEGSPLPPDIKNDSVFHYVIVRRYDTIFQTVVIQRNFSNDGPQPFFSSVSYVEKNDSVSVKNDLQATIVQVAASKKTPPLHLTPALIEQKSLIFTENDDSAALQKTDLTEKKAPKNGSLKTLTDSAGTVVEKKLTPMDTSLLINKKVEKSDEKTTNSIEKQAERQDKKRLPVIRPLERGGYEIGLSSGNIFFKAGNILRQKGLFLSGMGGVFLSGRLRLIGEAQFASLDYDVDQISNRQDIPMVAPPTPNDQFTVARVNQPEWNFSLGLQYAFLRTRFQPFIGLDVVEPLKLEEKIEYKFNNLLTQEDVFINARRNEAAFQNPFLRLNAGAESPVFGKLRAQLEGSFDAKLKNSSPYQSIWQLKGAILYRF